MSNDDRMGLGIVTIGVVFLLGMAGKGHVAWGGSWSGVGTAVGLFVAAGLALAVLTRFTTTRSRSRTRTVHIDAGTWKDAARHEAGHLAAMKRYGGTRLRARIYADGSGWASADLPPLTPDEELAIDYAGGYAEGSWHACGADLKQADEVLANVVFLQRGRMASRGRSRARKAVAGGRTNRFRRRLERTGRW